MHLNLFKCMTIFGYITFLSLKCVQNCGSTCSFYLFLFLASLFLGLKMIYIGRRDNSNKLSLNGVADWMAKTALSVGSWSVNLNHVNPIL